MKSGQEGNLGLLGKGGRLAAIVPPPFLPGFGLAWCQSDHILYAYYCGFVDLLRRAQHHKLLPARILSPPFFSVLCFTSRSSPSPDPTKKHNRDRPTCNRPSTRASSTSREQMPCASRGRAARSGRRGGSSSPTPPSRYGYSANIPSRQNSSSAGSSSSSRMMQRGRQQQQQQQQQRGRPHRTSGRRAWRPARR